MKTFIIIVFSIFSLSLYSQNDTPKRNSYKLEIAANETQQYAADIPESPYFVKEKILQIYCGEKIFVECEIQGDSISKMKVVEKNINPEKTIIIDFSQNSENRKEIRTDLNVKNPFSKKLIYEALMFTPISQKWKSTSIIPIMPNLENFEMWPHSIVTLVLENWKLE
ncbi:hypothetical protein [Chryseobacterium caseinilyticum]|uniref:Uncharacterized protein n=1 Tax=Chryseobacterium caseinilyticum TaxID=2771428 RepID=A0ABR8ZDC7_9FLAO|nr:hypothetical protein [Chryseobacterium caseinilyticum]MBD8083299.1 hypothetical protein [Chryseobacterium caseinilyticum]